MERVIYGGVSGSTPAHTPIDGTTPEIPKELVFLNTEKSMHPEIHLLKPLILTVVTPILLLFATGVFGIFRGKGPTPEIPKEPANLLKPCESLGISQ